jgi:osmotically inducible protein OsmC
MAVRQATAKWQGTLKEGTGHLALQSGAFEGPYSFSTRFEDGTGTNPEELLGAAHAGCYSMALNAALERAGHTPNYVNTTAKVHLERTDKGMAITKIELDVEADVPGLSDADFQQHAEATKTGCIISAALASVPMELTARLVSA